MNRSRTDWSELRRRIEESRAATGRTANDAEESQRILRERAGALAARNAEGSTDAALDLIEFALGRETYAIEASYVRQICPLTDLTVLPSTPPFVLGIVNLHGTTVSVIDIGRFFELPERGLTDLNKVIVLEAGRMSFGILADTILGLRRTLLSDITSSLPTLTGVREKYLRGVTRDHKVVLDAGKLINDREVIVHHSNDR